MCSTNKIIRVKMKRYFTLAIILFLAVSWQQTRAQIIKGEAIVGMNLTQVDGDEVYGFKKIGANIGAGVMIPFDKKGRWDVSIEALFSQKGANQNAQYSDTIDGEVRTGAYRLNLNYVEVPVLVMYTDKDRISAGAGFSWGRLVSVKEWEHGKIMDSTTVANGVYSPNDFAILADVRIRLWEGLKLNLRYQYSLVKIRTRDFNNYYTGETWTRNQYNNVISIRLIYVFNEKKSREYYRDARAH